MGSEMHLFKKTGGGAYELMRNTTMNDMTFLDPFAWSCSYSKNGDINLFPPPAPTAKRHFALLGVG